MRGAGRGRSRSGFGEYAASFAESRSDGLVLLQLNDQDLRELGVAALGDCKRLLAAIASLVRPAAPAAAPAADQTSPASLQGPLAYTPRHLVARILDTRSELEGERKHVTARLANVYNYLAAHHWQAGERGKAIEAGERGLALAQQEGDFSVSVTTMQHPGFALIARHGFRGGDTGAPR